MSQLVQSTPVQAQPFSDHGWKRASGDPEHQFHEGRLYERLQDQRSYHAVGAIGQLLAGRRGVSATDRRDQRRQRLIDAGLELFGTRGIAPVGIVDVCAEAGLTKRYFYENFASIDTLADAVFEHVTGNLVAAVAPAIEVGAGRDPRPALTVYTHALLSDPRVVRLLAVESQAGPLKKYRDEFPTRAVELWFTFATADDGLPPPDEMRLKAYGFIGAALEIGIAWLDGQLPLTMDEVIDQLVEMFYRISGIAPP